MRYEFVLKYVRWNPSVFLASFLANLLALAMPLALLQIYDRVIPNAAYETLIVLACLVAGALLIDVALRIARARLLAFAAADFEVDAYNRALWALVMEDPSKNKRADHGTLVTRMGAIDRVRGFTGDSVAATLLDLPFALLFLGVIALLAPSIAVVVTAVLCLTFVALIPLRKNINAARRERQAIEARRYSFFREVLSSIMPIRALNVTSLMSRRQERLLAQSAKQTQVLTSNTNLAQGIAATVGNLTPLVTAAAAGYLVLNGQASIGVLAAVVVLSGRIVQPFLRLEGFLAEIDNIWRAEKDLESLTQAPLKSGGPHRLDRVQHLRLQNVTTSADGDIGIALEEITVSLKPGDCLLLKSNSPRRLVAAERLFLGEAGIKSGQFTLNGRDISEFDLRDRQNRIRILPEEPQMLDGTLYDNICAFQPDRYATKALELAQDLGLQDIMLDNPHGLMARDHLNGKSIPHSAKRIATNIAGLVTQPDVIVFRAAYSGLDLQADKRLLNWLKQNAKNHILILATNRPSYAALATHQLDLSAPGSAPDDEARDG